VVLDLDDTLYPEADYVASGARAVAHHLADLYGVDCEAALLKDAARGGDWLAKACELAGLPAAAKPSFLWLYRLHPPSIGLSADTQAALDLLRGRCRQLVILTDGRSVTQRLKLAALGMSDVPAYISEEWESEKPDPRRFEQVMRDWPAERYVYVGDNAAKDFIGPNRLGWLTLGVRLGPAALYANRPPDLAGDSQPAHWLGALSEVAAYL